LRVRHGGQQSLFWTTINNIINEIHWREKIKNLKVTHGRVAESEKGETQFFPALININKVVVCKKNTAKVL
jgi:hypothetical protein